MMYFILKPWVLPSEWLRPDLRTVPLCESLGSVLADTVKSRADVPAYDLSLRDGWAVRTADGALRTPSSQSVLNGVRPDPLRAGEARRVSTGGMIPEGADAVIASADPDAPLPASEQPEPGRHILRRGADWQAGDVILGRGTRIGAGELALMLEAGIDEVRVCALPSVGIVGTGSELLRQTCRGPHSPLRCSSDTCYLRALFLSAGIRNVQVRLCGDSEEEIAAALRELSRTSTFLITVGGTGRGSRDLTRRGITLAGGRLYEEPGCSGGALPFIAASLGEAPLIGLPGNPLGALMIAQRVILPLIREKCRQPLFSIEQVRAVFRGSVPEPTDGELCVSLSSENGELYARPVKKGTGCSKLFRTAGGIVLLQGRPLDDGDVVTVERFLN